jgi:hypothetical protein
MPGESIGLGNVDAATQVVGADLYVPEPGTIILLGLGGLALIRLRRK